LTYIFHNLYRHICHAFVVGITVVIISPFHMKKAKFLSGHSHHGSWLNRFRFRLRIDFKSIFKTPENDDIRTLVLFLGGANCPRTTWWPSMPASWCRVGHLLTFKLEVWFRFQIDFKSVTKFQKKNDIWA
jgi:hypothetical protein